MRNIDKKYHYLYKTTNLINNKYYYGIHSTNNIDDGYLGSGTYLRRAIRKYGKDNFKREIIKMFDSREELVQAEIEIITETVLKDKQNMNCQYGGEGFNTIGMVTVRDKNGVCFKVFCNDPRYLSGELISVVKNQVTVKDNNNNIFNVHIYDKRYLSGELNSITKNTILVKDINGNNFRININDERYLSGELISYTTGKIQVKDINGNNLLVDKNDPRYLNGELTHFFQGKKHTDETKKKMSQSSKGMCVGEKNGSFGTCWITKDNENKKIKKEELNHYLNNGWFKGRNIKK